MRQGIVAALALIASASAASAQDLDGRFSVPAAAAIDLTKTFDFNTLDRREVQFSNCYIGYFGDWAACLPREQGDMTIKLVSANMRTKERGCWTSTPEYRCKATVSGWFQLSDQQPTLVVNAIAWDADIVVPQLVATVPTGTIILSIGDQQSILHLMRSCADAIRLVANKGAKEGVAQAKVSASEFRSTAAQGIDATEMPTGAAGDFLRAFLVTCLDSVEMAAQP